MSKRVESDTSTVREFGTWIATAHAEARGVRSLVGKCLMKESATRKSIATACTIRQRENNEKAALLRTWSIKEYESKQ